TSATCTTRTLTTKLVRCLPVSVRRISAVLCIVLPVAALAADVAVEIVVTIVIIIVVDLDVATVPIAIAPVATPSAPSGGTESNSRTPSQGRSWHVAWISIRVIRIGRRSSSVHHGRIIRRDIDNVGVGGLNCDHLIAAGHCLGLHCRLCASL